MPTETTVSFDGIRTSQDQAEGPGLDERAGGREICLCGGETLLRGGIFVYRLEKGIEQG